MKPSKKELDLPLLSALVIGSVIGAAVFNLPSDSAKSGSGLTVILAWIIIAIGVLSLASCFYNLNIRKPKLHGGMFNYAKSGFGPFVGSLTGWGY